MLLYVAITALDVRLACSDGNELVLPDRYLLKTSDDTCRNTVLEVQLSGRSLCILSRDLRQCAGHVWASVSWNAQVAYPNVRMFLSPQLTCLNKHNKHLPNRHQPRTMRSRNLDCAFIWLAFWLTESEAIVSAIGKGWFKGQALQARLRQACSVESSNTIRKTTMPHLYSLQAGSF